MSTRHQVIFDTDIGTDVDDILALGFLLGSPEEIDLIGVTTPLSRSDVLEAERALGISEEDLVGAP